ncbi:hypothetical protein AC792_13010 [Arthrobacter sp. RIT-PI-e]|uniref:YchJ family protein n=1 Tax=Arthrobacter sp. RIT-PI-e TaxID=1681197 RepID=UPI0006760718|nr:YchJ family metal-binding protein [Arthrobacter sp. RIT-PI-e]KNC18187.1 hypothetical protein AC792_13010 [Arthrobacter sp. RIT-PI-e]
MTYEGCPCGSQLTYQECCEPLHRGAGAPTALALMRSRFSAFALGLEGYLLDSWDPSTRPDTVDLDGDVEWRRLQIVDTALGGASDDTGVVEYRASFRRAGRPGLLQERSRFVRVRGRWRYVDGDVRP